MFQQLSFGISASSSILTLMLWMFLYHLQQFSVQGLYNKQYKFFDPSLYTTIRALNVYKNIFYGPGCQFKLCIYYD